VSYTPRVDKILIDCHRGNEAIRDQIGLRKGCFLLLVVNVAVTLVLNTLNLVLNTVNYV
jgi:hypothetical protein